MNAPELQEICQVSSTLSLSHGERADTLCPIDPKEEDKMATDRTNQQVKLKDGRMLGYVNTVLPGASRSSTFIASLVHGLTGSGLTLVAL